LERPARLVPPLMSPLDCLQLLRRPASAVQTSFGLTRPIPASHAIPPPQLSTSSPTPASPALPPPPTTWTAPTTPTPASARRVTSGSTAPAAAMLPSLSSIRAVGLGAPPATCSPEEPATTTSPRAATASMGLSGTLPLKNAGARVLLPSFSIMCALSARLLGRE
jgi:hypothetical protein